MQNATGKLRNTALLRNQTVTLITCLPQFTRYIPHFTTAPEVGILTMCYDIMQVVTYFLVTASRTTRDHKARTATNYNRSLN